MQILQTWLDFQNRSHIIEINFKSLFFLYLWKWNTVCNVQNKIFISYELIAWKTVCTWTIYQFQVSFHETKRFLTKGRLLHYKFYWFYNILHDKEKNNIRKNLYKSVSNKYLFYQENSRVKSYEKKNKTNKKLNHEKRNFKRDRKNILFLTGIKLMS